MRLSSPLTTPYMRPAASAGEADHVANAPDEDFSVRPGERRARSEVRESKPLEDRSIRVVFGRCGSDGVVLQSPSARRASRRKRARCAVCGSPSKVDPRRRLRRVRDPRRRRNRTNVSHRRSIPHTGSHHRCARCCRSPLRWPRSGESRRPRSDRRRSRRGSERSRPLCARRAGHRSVRTTI